VSKVAQRAEYGTGEPGAHDVLDGVQFTLDMVNTKNGK
jgi:hypothetical protein